MSSEDRRRTSADVRNERLGRSLEAHLDGWLEKDGKTIDRITLINKGGEYLMVWKIRDEEEQPWVCFVSGETMASTLRRAINAYHTEALKWREDKPYKK